MRPRKTKGIARSIKERAERIGRAPFQDETPIEIDEDELLYEELDRLTRTKDIDDELRAKGLTNGIGRTNGLINGLGRTNGLINGNGRTNGRVNGIGRINGLINGTGRTNGLVNGVGRTNGLINGNGRTNGLINGIGRTNGMINGTEVGDYEYLDEGFEDPKGRRPRRKKLALIRYSAIIMGLLFLFSVSTSMIPEEPGKPSRITVDGQLSDWSGIERYNEPGSSENSDVDLQTYAVLSEKEILSVLMTVQGTALGDPTGYDAFYLFVDADISMATGYLHEGLGVDYAIEIYGGGNSVKVASLLEFQPGDQHNWSAFTTIGGIDAAVSGSNLEAQIPLSIAWSISEDSIFAIHTDDFEGGGLDSSLHFREELGALEVTFQAVEENCIITSVPQDVIQLTFVARGSEVAVDSVSITMEGLGQLGSVAPFNLPSSQVTVRTVGLSSLTANPGDLIIFTLNEVRADRPVKIRGESVKCYYQSAPSEKKIDGWFGDWSGEAEIDDQNLPLDQASRDIKEYSASLEPTLNETFFYARVFGEMLEGSSVPRKIVKSLAQGDPNYVPAAPRQWKEKRTGEDFLRIYIDSNTSDVDGAHINNFPMILDYMIQVTGKNGVILNSSVFEWGPGWDFLMSIPAEKNMDSIEMSVPSWLFGSVNNTEMLFDMTDWRSSGDSNSLQTAWQSRSGTRTVYLVQNTNNAATTTAYSTQRKVFHDGTYFWSFYYDGVQGKTMYEYSNEGDDWTNTAVSAFSTSGVLYPSVWYDSGNSAVYIIGDNSASDTTVITRKGAISGTSISWGSEYTVTVSGSSLGSKVAFISQDSSGYLWVISSSQETNYNCAAVRSTNTDDISAWDSRTVIRTAGDVSNNYVYPMIYPLGSGDVYAIWYADGNIEGRGYDAGSSSWDANEVSIVTTTASKTNRGPSAVVDSSNTIHLIYSDTNGYIKYRYKTTAGSWTDGSSDPEAVESANGYPTLSILTSNDDLYAFYIRSNQVRCKKWGGSSWSTITMSTDGLSKTYLTSTYSASQENWTALNWRGYESFDDETRVYFERVPEFSDILPPFLSVLIIGLASKRMSKRKEEKSNRLDH